ncbi:unnamed protein product [Rotaria sordida]|uniref:Uncharacterized protein n=1 Tax=Rotaria sordida TaxID=392033 RepID=A0A814NV72_9BILA|nr:unnamed protein product [Rotaria sordida]CAF1513523.1 unnamed protein product [Rotaria sordida]
MDDRQNLQSLQKAIDDLNDRRVLLDTTLTDMLRTGHPKGQPQNLDVERNELVIQIITTEIPFVASKHNLLVYDKEQFLRRQGENNNASVVSYQMDDLQNLQSLQKAINDLSNRRALLETTLNNMLRTGQPHNFDVERNYLVVQTIRMEIPFVVSQYNLLVYDKEEFLKRQGANNNPGVDGGNSSISGDNSGASRDNRGVSSGNAGANVHH